MIHVCAIISIQTMQNMTMQAISLIRWLCEISVGTFNFLWKMVENADVHFTSFMHTTVTRRRKDVVVKDARQVW